LFFWQRPVSPTPQYRHKIFQDFYIDDELATYQHQRSKGFWSGVSDKLGVIWDAFVNPNSGNWQAGAVARPQPFWVFFLALPLAIRTRRSAWIPLALFVTVPLLHFMMTPWFRSQYMAPVLGCFFVVMTLCVRQLCRFRLGNWWIGRGIVTATIALILI